MLRNTFCAAATLLIIFALKLVNIHGQNVNSGLKIGDECVFNDTLNGFCQKVDECDYLRQQSPNSKIIPDEFKKSICLSQGRNQLVCCPSIYQPENLRYNAVEYTKFEKMICKNKEPQIVIIGNTEQSQYADPGEFQFQALIGYKIQNKIKSENKNDEYIFACGGALIAEDIVITSAYCLRKPRKPAVVKIGATSFVPDEDDPSTNETIKIEDSLPHPDYSIFTNENDIGLIKLARPYNKSLWSISPICITTYDDGLPVNFTVTGYNIDTRNGPLTAAPWLLKQLANIHSTSLFSNRFRAKRLKVFDAQVCVAAFNEVNSCVGDIGGPMIYEQIFQNGGSISYLYAIKSRGFGCNTTLPSIYTKVFPYIDWIERGINQLESGGPRFF
ncbi:chymotrypsinogen B2-like [Chironomus tepperi]|uniref:chymotrypsinogen B2-like n=1 Tax=Chironomus tepperi TaxID=113505 RepID=UPI00391F5FCB